MSDGDDVVKVEWPRPNVACVTLNRPTRLNALTAEMVSRLYLVLADLARDPSARVVLLTGEGRGFCSGLDLGGYGVPAAGSRGRVETRHAIQEELAGLAQAIRQVPCPVVAVVNGLAVGGGMALAMLCDLRFMSDEATFEPNFVRLGLSAGDLGLTWMLPRLTGVSNAMELLLSGRSIPASRALQLALVSAVFPVVDLMEEALSLAGAIALHSPFAVARTKQLIWDNLDSSEPAALRHEAEAQVLCSLTDDFRNAVRTFGGRAEPPSPGDRATTHGGGAPS